jgi:hypothetical protein
VFVLWFISSSLFFFSFRLMTIMTMTAVEVCVHYNAAVRTKMGMTDFLDFEGYTYMRRLRKREEAVQCMKFEQASAVCYFLLFVFLPFALLASRGLHIICYERRNLGMDSL